MASNRGTGKLLFIAGGIIFLIAISIVIFFLVKRNSCPKDLSLEVSPSTEVLANDLITFSAKTEGKVTGYQWDFGDNIKDESKRKNIVTHRFTKEGKYTVSVSINKGCKTVTKVIIVKSPEIIIPEAPTLMPVIVGPANGVVRMGELVKFKDETPGATSWEWFFEGGRDIKSEKEVTYIFDTQGEKTVQLVVNGGKSLTASYKIKVIGAKPKLLLQVEPKPGGGGGKPKPQVKNVITEIQFKEMLMGIVTNKTSIKEFSPFLNGNLAMKIEVNGGIQQFDALCKDLVIESHPRIDKVFLTFDPETGFVVDIKVIKN